MYVGRTPMRAASLRRLEDAEMLYKTGRWLGAIYLHGYWVEMTIKVRLMEEYGVNTLEALNLSLQRHFRLRVPPETHRTHSIHWLTGFLPGFIRLREASVLRKEDIHTLRNLQLVATWTSELRYSPDSGSRLEAEEFMAAAQTIVKFIKHS